MATPLPPDFLEWQVKLREFTMQDRNGAPHAGVAPLLTVRAPGMSLGVVTHSIICGLLPHPSKLAEKTEDFRKMYESGIKNGARAIYDRGIAYLKNYYVDAADFDPSSITTLLPKDGPIVRALRSDPNCALCFYVFDLQDRSEVGRFRCIHIDCVAEVHSRGPVYDNVWWHNTLFHGLTDDHVVVRFEPRAAFDTRFGRLEELR